MLGEPVYWLTLVLVTLVGLFLVVYEETRKKKDESTERKDDLSGDSPVSHIDECLCSIDEIFSDGLFAAVCRCFVHGSSAQDGARQVAGTPDAPASPTWAWMSGHDHALGRRVYLTTQRSLVLRHVATAVTLSGDEAMWLVLPVLLAVGHCTTGLGPPTSYGFCMELMGDVMMCCVIEMGLKFCVQRDRPAYARQSTFYILPGEWWSFPSGHAMRGAYLAQRMTSSPVLRLALLGPWLAGSAVPMYIMHLWGMLVAWSRVAKGRHSPLDVVAGLLCGLLLSELTVLIGPYMWTIGRIIAGSAECLQLGLMAARPELRLEGFYTHLGLQILWFSTLPYGLWLSVSWTAVFALGLTLFCTSYALGLVSSPHKPCVF